MTPAPGLKGYWVTPDGDVFGPKGKRKLRHGSKGRAMGELFFRRAMCVSFGNASPRTTVMERSRQDLAFAQEPFGTFVAA